MFSMKIDPQVYLILQKIHFFYLENRTTLILTRVLHIFYAMMHLTYFVLPLGFAALVFFAPCTAPLIGSIMLPRSSPYCSTFTTNLTLPQILVRLNLAVTDGLLLSKCFIGGTFYNMDVLLTGIAFLVLECDIAANCENPKLTVYRKLQVLEKILNAAVKTRVLPTNSFVLPVLQIASCFALVKLHDQLDFSELPIYVVVYVDVVVFNTLTFTGAARVYILGDNLLRRLWEKIRGGRKGNSRGKRMMLKSFRRLRVEFGNNFVDRLTPLVLQDFCAKQSISMLVVSSAAKKAF